jgi:NADPH:quinone reductase-like Zn-dependent oxidoreductase
LKAVLCPKYGPADRLRIAETPAPVPGPNEVLVKIHATAVNDYDWSMIRGKPRVLRLLFGIFKPKNPIPGMELAGVVEACGPDARTFQPGDAVYGDTSDHTFGAFAEYVCVPEKALRKKPEGMSFVDAAALPHAAGLAIQGLRDVGGIKPGRRILVNGAGGGVGTCALQIARAYEAAEVTGVDTGDKLEMMRDLGYDRVIDYKREDFTKIAQRYDLILDAKTKRSPFAYARALNAGGIYVTVGGSLPRLIQILCIGPLISRFTKKRLSILALKANEGLDTIETLFAEGRLRCVIDGPYPLEKAAWAVQRFGAGEHSGKIVLTPET